MVNEIIAQLRKDAGLSQAETAERLGVSRSTYADIEKGRDLKASEITAISELYEVDPSDILAGKKIEANEFADEVSLTSYSDAAEDALEREDHPKLQGDKVRELLLYLSEKIGAKPNVGETVLYKLLYFIDFDFFEKNKRPITGMTYIKNHFGPTPGKSFASILTTMQKDNDLEIVNSKYFDHLQRKYLPLRKPNLTIFTGEEIKHIDWEIERLSDKSATELTELSHFDTPWIVAKDKQPLGYRFVFYRGDKTSVTEPPDEL